MMKNQLCFILFYFYIISYVTVARNHVNEKVVSHDVKSNHRREPFIVSGVRNKLDASSVRNKRDVSSVRNKRDAAPSGVEHYTCDCGEGICILDPTTTQGYRCLCPLEEMGPNCRVVRKSREGRRYPTEQRRRYHQQRYNDERRRREQGSANKKPSPKKVSPAKHFGEEIDEFVEKSQRRNEEIQMGRSGHRSKKGFDWKGILGLIVFITFAAFTVTCGYYTYEEEKKVNWIKREKRTLYYKKSDLPKEEQDKLWKEKVTEIKKEMFKEKNKKLDDDDFEELWKKKQSGEHEDPTGAVKKYTMMFVKKVTFSKENRKIYEKYIEEKDSDGEKGDDNNEDGDDDDEDSKKEKKDSSTKKDDASSKKESATSEKGDATPKK